MKYKYDKKDNLQEKKRLVDGEVVNELDNEYDEENRLIKSGEKTYSYDKDGNQIQAGKTSFDYMASFVNSKNVKRLKSVEGSGEHVASYSYTLEGQRTGKYLDSGESKISYHYSGRNVQYEKWSDGRTVRYTHPSTGSSSCSSCGGCGGSSSVLTDHPISIEVNGRKHYYLYNGQGSVTELINADEEVVNQYRYTPFGSPRLKVEDVYNPYEYTGRRLDEETGQYYYRTRMYSAEQSRFTTQDPAGMQEGPNMYAYVGNNPVNKRDPSGLNPPPEGIDGGGGYSNNPPVGTGFYWEWASYNEYGWEDGPGIYHTCPKDDYYDTFEECVHILYEDVGGISMEGARDQCCDYCYESYSNDVEMSCFVDCMGWTGMAGVASCVFSALGLAAWIGSLVFTSGASIFMGAVAIGGTITSCSVAAYQVNQCINQCS